MSLGACKPEYEKAAPPGCLSLVPGPALPATPVLLRNKPLGAPGPLSPPYCSEGKLRPSGADRPQRHMEGSVTELGQDASHPQRLHPPLAVSS